MELHTSAQDRTLASDRPELELANQKMRQRRQNRLPEIPGRLEQIVSASTNR